MEQHGNLFGNILKSLMNFNQYRRRACADYKMQLEQDKLERLAD